MVHDIEGSRTDRSKGAGPGSDIQGGGAVGAIICQQELGGDWRHNQGPDGVLPSSVETDHRDDRKTWGRQSVVVPISRGSDGSRRDPPHQGVHQEAVDEHSGEGGLPPRLCSVYRGGADDGDNPVGAMVGSRRGK